MKRILTICAALAATVLLGGAPVAAQAPAAAVPLEVYGRLPGLEEVVISPDGEKLAYITVAGEARRVNVQTLSGQVLGQVGLGDQKVRDIRWGSPSHLLITTSSTGRVCTLCDRGENLIVQSYNVNTRKFAVMMGTSNGAVGAFVGAPPTVRRVNGKDIVLVTGYIEHKNQWDPAQFVLDLDTGHGKLFDFNFGVMDEKGYIVAAREHYRDARWRAVTFEGKALREIFKRERVGLDPPVLHGYGRTTDKVIISELVEDERRYYEVALADGALTPFDVPPGAEPIFDPRTDRLLGMHTLKGDEVEYSFRDPDLAAAWARVATTFKGRNPQVVSWTPDRKKAVLLVNGREDTGVYILMDFAANTASEIGPRYPAIAASQVHEVRFVTYKAADGMEIPAYLTLPRGREAKGLPLIVMPHGGPQLRDEPGFDWWAQAMASRGYAVLQPQFRGSDGFGMAHLRAGYGEWGRKMQSDLSDGVRWLAGQGTVDASRVCIVGASYGGYAAMAGASLEQGVYRCAVAVAGVSDLRRMLLWEKNQTGAANSLGVRYWRRYMGADRINDSALAEISPAQQAERFNAPILLIHGKDDLVVPFEQSEILARALKRADKPYELVTLAGEDHWLSRGTTRLQMLNATVGFVEKHNPPE